MKVWQRLGFCTALALTVLWPAGAALAVSVSGRASTELEWYDTADGETAVPVYQYLLLNVKDIDGDGLDFRGYGRLADDLSNEVSADSRLYYGFLEKDNLLDGLDLRLGRQFISTTAGASLMDGLRLKYSNLGPLGVEVFGGGDVSYYEGYNADDLMWGTELSGKFMDDNLRLGVSYLQKWEDSDLAKELIGFDASYDFPSLLQIYNETQYSWLTEDVTYFLVGAKYYRSPKWTLRTEYLYSLPVFSATSIYSVFAVSEYEQLMAELNYKITTGLNAFGRYTREMNDEFDDANVFEAGLEKIRTDRFSGYLVGTWRDDEEGQDLAGVKAYAAYVFCPQFQGGLGAHLDVLERRLDDDEDDTTSSRIWVDGTYYVTKAVNVQAKVERVESDLWDEYYRGRVRLNVTF